MTRVVLALSCLVPVTAAADRLPFVLASAQVATSTASQPILRLGASGPIAFETRALSEGGLATTATRVVLRLYGVTALPGLASGLQPFALSSTAMPDGCELVIDIGTLPSGWELNARTPQRSNELEIVAAPSRPAPKATSQKPASKGSKPKG